MCLRGGSLSVGVDCPGVASLKGWSFQGGGGVSKRWFLRGMCPGGMQTPYPDTLRYSQLAVGTHTTGMYSCCLFYCLCFKMRKIRE